jgi:hypothetical protein
MVELRNMLSRELGRAMPLSSTVLFDYPNLAALVHHVDDTLYPQVVVQPVVCRAACVEPLAIVGMACRFGGGVISPGSLWTFLQGRGEPGVAVDLFAGPWRCRAGNTAREV